VALLQFGGERFRRGIEGIVSEPMVGWPSLKKPNNIIAKVKDFIFGFADNYAFAGAAAA